MRPALVPLATALVAAATLRKQGDGLPAAAR